MQNDKDVSSLRQNHNQLLNYLLFLPEHAAVYGQNVISVNKIMFIIPRAEFLLYHDIPRSTPILLSYNNTYYVSIIMFNLK